MDRRKARTPEARENQLIDLAVDLAEKQLLEGTASSMVITHYLRMGSMKERLERDKLRAENEHLRAKTESLEAARKSDEKLERAIKAFTRYSGHPEEVGDDQDIY